MTAEKFKYVKIDETNFSNKDFVKTLGFGSKILATYIFDETEGTYCCELVPSYFLRYAGTEIVPGRNVDFSCDEWEAFEEIIRESECMNDNDHYVHCSSIKNCRPVPTDAETIDDVLEDFSSNPW